MPAFRQQRPRLTTARVILLAIGGMVLVLIVTFAVVRLGTRREIERELAAIRAAGQPVTLLELDAAYADHPAARARGKELADLLERFNALRNELAGPQGTGLLSLPGIGSASVPPPDTPLDDDVKRLANESLAAARAELDQLHRLLATDDLTFRFPISLTNGFNTLLPHLASMKGTQSWLQLQTLLALGEGDADQAVAATIDMFRLSRTLEEEPFLISQLVRIALFNMAAISAERLAAADRLDAGQLPSLRRELRLAASTNWLHSAMQAERCVGFATIWDSPNVFAALGQAANPKLGARAVNLVYRMTGLRDRDASYYLTHLNRTAGMATNPVSSRLTFAGEFARLNPPQWYFFSRLAMPAPGKAYEKEAYAIARGVALDAALAVVEFQMRNGQPPADWSPLIPEFIAAVPVDPRDDTPLKLVRTATGFRIDGQSPLVTIK